MDKNDSEELLNRVENIESILNEYLSFKSIFGDYDQIVKSYFRLVQLFLTHGKITPSLLSGVKIDPISENILEILFNLEKGNVSQITDELRKERGSASRTTVRKKLKEMEEANLVVHTGEKENYYRISEEVVKKWLKMVGMNIRYDGDKTGRGEKDVR